MVCAAAEGGSSPGREAVGAELSLNLSSVAFFCVESADPEDEKRCSEIEEGVPDVGAEPEPEPETETASEISEGVPGQGVVRRLEFSAGQAPDTLPTMSSKLSPPEPDSGVVAEPSAAEAPADTGSGSALNGRRPLRPGESMLHVVLMDEGWSESLTLRIFMGDDAANMVAEYIDKSVQTWLASPVLSRGKAALTKWLLSRKDPVSICLHSLLLARPLLLLLDLAPCPCLFRLLSLIW